MRPPDLTSQWDDLGEFIRSQREITQLSLRRLAEMAGVSNPYLSQIERGLRRPSAEILQQIAKALRISAESLYVRAGILDDDFAPHVSVREAIQADPELTAEQKHTLLTVYDSFLAQRPATERGAGLEDAGHHSGDGVAEGTVGGPAGRES
jgi:transcriptional regulator with XRE-family HTH domain